MNTPSISITLLLLLLLLGAGCRRDQEAGETVSATAPGARTVEIRKDDGRFRLYRNGEPFFIKGAAGHTNLRLIRQAGGNAIRTYTIDGLETLLDRAHELGLAVMVGLYVGRATEGFDYSNAEAVEAQYARIRAEVERYKDHPAVLCWAVGNEPDNSMGDKKRLWPELRRLVDLVHEIDPHHPVTIPVYNTSADALLKHCPNLDFLSINIFGNLSKFVDNYTGDKPYIFTEFGALGPWESPPSFWYAIREESIVQKHERIRSAYRNHILTNGSILGSFVFYWGQKQEYTPTWFSFFAESGEKTPLVDLMFELWGGGQPENRAPFTDSLVIDGQEEFMSRSLLAGQVYEAGVRGFDPENDPLRYHWEIIADGPFFDHVPGRGKVEIRPPALPGLIQKNGGARITFRAPDHTGAYRLLVYAYDGMGNASYANMPFLVENNTLTEL